MKNIFVGY